MIEENAKNRLLKYLTNGSTVYCILRHKSNSGTSRRISFFTIADGKPINLDYFIGVVMDKKQPSKEGLTFRGCGMDIGFAAVYDLSNVLGLSLKHEWI